MNYHVMNTGQTGTGKSMNLYSLLNKIDQNYHYNAFTFSA